MKFSCYKKDLTDALHFAARAANEKAYSPELSGILFRAENHSLEIAANNLNIAIRANIPCHCEENGSAFVNGNRLVSFVRSMPDDTLTCSADDKFLYLQSGGANVELLSMNPANFTEFQPLEQARTFQIKSVAFREAIQRTAFAAAKQTDRPIFTGVLFEIKNNRLSLVATNTYRLALTGIVLDNPCDEAAFVLPADTLTALLAKLDAKDTDKVVTVNFAERGVTFAFDNFFVQSRRVEGIFPPYQKIIPADFSTRVSVDTAELKRAVNFISLMCNQTVFNTVTLNINDNGIELSANSEQIGGAFQPVEANFDGDELTILFNVNYLADALKVIDSPQVKLAFNDKYSPAVMTEPDNDNWLYVITPCKE